MPSVTTGKVLVSGANGYIAVWVAKKLLEQGFAVRGTVRSESKGTHLKEIFKEYEDKFEVTVVEDITKEGAFDEAVKGVDAIEHTASPFHFRADDPNELIGPAVAGTGGILQSALLYGSTVKRVVVTSSCAAVLEPVTSPRVFSEENWNNHSLKEVEEKGNEATQADKYRASKTLAERAAWAFYEKNKDKVTWDLVVLNPPFVFGPFLHEVESPGSLNSSLADWWKYVVKGGEDLNQLVTAGSSWIDVRDLALAHVLALKQEKAAENRIIVSAGPFFWQDWVNAARGINKEIAPGNTSYDQTKAVYPLKYDVSKATQLLGISYIGIDESTRDMLTQFKEKGWF